MADIAYMAQKHPGTCALVSLGNALLHLGIIPAPWDQDGAEFQKIREVSGGVHGSPTKIEEAWAMWTGPYSFSLRVEEFNAVEIGCGTVTKLIEDGMVVALPVWHEKIGLHSALIVGLSEGRFTAVNRVPFSAAEPLVSTFRWEDLGYKRWNVPVVAYGRGARKKEERAARTDDSVWEKIKNPHSAMDESWRGIRE